MRIRHHVFRQRRPEHMRPVMRELRDESGVIAILVALSISTFLLGFAALAVDLGTAYVRKAELKSLAEKVALAGAAGLPTVSDGLDAALTTLGTAADGASPGSGLCAGLDLPGVCDAGTGWAQDGDDTNGEITFYAAGEEEDLDDVNGDGTLDTLDKVLGATTAAGIHVLLPPSEVPFGLAQGLGFNSASLQSTATARIGTPLGAGILPFALTPVDLTNGQFCTQDPAAATSAYRPIDNPIGLNPVLQAPDDKIPANTLGRKIDIRLSADIFVQPTIRVFFENDLDQFPTGQRVTRNGDHWTVEVPQGEPGSSVRIWAQGTWGIPPFVTGFTSYSDTITYIGPSPSGISPCTLPQANRGYVKLARSAAGDTLAPNIRSGPQVKLFPTGGLVGTVGTTLGCVSTVLSSPLTTCLASDLTTPFASRMTKGFFDSDAGRPGRLIGDCGGGSYSVHGNTLDDTALLDSGSPLLDPSFGSASQLRTRILGGTDPGDSKKGWIRAQAFKCPRLAVMPVVDPNPLTTVLGGQNITKLEYVWIDDDGSGRGLAWNGNNLRSFRGYVVDPKYLPEVVAGSPVVGPYLGPDMPKEALLLPDFS